MNTILKGAVKTVLSLAVIFTFHACTQDSVIAPKNDDKHYVTEDQALELASVIELPNISVDGKMPEPGTKVREIEEYLAVPGKNDKSSFYIINYEKQGFVVISAENRVEPIRAFSATGKFDLVNSELPGGLVDWLSETSDMIAHVRTSDLEQTKAMEDTWRICPVQKNLVPIDDGDCGGGGGGCEDSFTRRGPLMQTEWGQTGGFNDLVQNINCSAGTSPTGCVATAMAQIMRFHQSPSRYRWTDMANNWGTAETARLMRDIGAAVDMDYSCSSSGAQSSDAASAFKNNFGYASATYQGFDRNKLKQQIGWNRPVYLAGHRNKSCFLGWCSYKNGHAWVSDGYQTSFHCETGTGYLFLHMNWGWSGTNNGWYAYNRWNPGERDYKYNKKMIYNIRP